MILIFESKNLICGKEYEIYETHLRCQSGSRQRKEHSLAPCLYHIRLWRFACGIWHLSHAVRRRTLIFAIFQGYTPHGMKSSPLALAQFQVSDTTEVEMNSCMSEGMIQRNRSNMGKKHFLFSLKFVWKNWSRAVFCLMPWEPNMLGSSSLSKAH